MLHLLGFPKKQTVDSSQCSFTLQRSHPKALILLSAYPWHTVICFCIALYTGCCQYAMCLDKKLYFDSFFADNMFNRQMQYGGSSKNSSSSNKEANLMPVPSPQQIQYLNPLDGQELTIQKQPNTSLRDQDLLSPS